MKTKSLVGVNLGGWLVLEKWITPSLFRGTDAEDEYTFCEQADTKELRQLERFRNRFITKRDFEWLAAHGVEAVRLPVGYWMFGDTKPYAPTVSYVDKAFKWASETGIRILIDLHGAPGSQNGRDHSGQKGKVSWSHDTRNIAETLEVIRRLAKRYGSHPALRGISLLNEPAVSIPKAILLNYYKRAYAIIRELSGQETWIVYSDGYVPWRWYKELSHSQFKNIYIDTHHYQVFSPIDTRLSPRLNLLRTQWWLPRTLARFRRHHPVIVGEWSLTLGSTKLPKLTAADQHRVIRSYGQLQLRAYQTVAAWFFWTYQTEGRGTWSFRDCIEKGLLESPAAPPAVH